MPTFNPAALLNPRAAAKAASKPAPKITPSLSRSDTGGSEPGMGSLVERLHNVERRDARPAKRQRQGPGPLDGNDDPVPVDQSKGTKHTTQGASGGEIGQYMREERQKAEARGNGPPESIVDLTADDDEVELVRDSFLEQEVCLGRVDGAKVNAYRIPTPKMSNFQGSKTHWQPMKIELRRRPGAANTNYIIDVYDPMGKDFGSVEPRIAKPLASVMDGLKLNGIRLQARIDMRLRKNGDFPGQATSDSFNITIVVYARRKYVAGLGKHFSQHQVWFRDPIAVDRGVPVVNPHAPKDYQPRPVKNSLYNRPEQSSTVYVTRTQEEVKEDVIKIFDNLNANKEIPEMEPCSDIITPLLAHQKQALYFMTQREKPRLMQVENGDAETSLWRRKILPNGAIRWMNAITGQQTREEPPQALGGILADVMGLGKTLNVLSLIATSMKDARAWAREEPQKDEVDLDGDKLTRAHTTLLLCPVTTLVNWTDQIKTHVKQNKLKHYIYQGAKRTDDPEELMKYDVVLTSYSTVSADFTAASRTRTNNPLSQISWFRVVLDEAHIIRTQSTNQSQAACALVAQRRWAVTGTPVQNKLDDLGALIKFLRIKPFDGKGVFTQYIAAPLKANDVSTVPKLRILVDGITLRRGKDKINLPGRREDIIDIQMSKEERDLYDSFASDSLKKVDMIQGGKKKMAGRSYAHFLKAVLRLRLLAAHGGDLLSDDDWNMAKGFDPSHAIDLEEVEDARPEHTPRQAFELFNLMHEAEVHFCIKCNKFLGPSEHEADEVDEEESEQGDADILGYLAPCNQLFCPSCYPEWMEEMRGRVGPDNYGRCSVCDSYIQLQTFTLRQSEIDADKESQEIIRKRKGGRHLSRWSGPHSKTKKLLDFMDEDEYWSRAHPAERPIKSVVFSEWVTHLDLIEMAFKERHIKFHRIDGSMSYKQRQQAIEDFNASVDCNVMLISIKAGGLGINLTAASRVYVMQPNYNPGVERQAIERVHRLGQTRDVIIRRMIMMNSIEGKVIERQHKKEQLAELSIERESYKKEDREEVQARKLQELRQLFC